MAYRPCSDCPLKTCSKCAQKSTRHKTGQRKKSHSRTSAAHAQTVRAIHKKKPVSLFRASGKNHSAPLFRLPQKRGHTSVSMVCFSEIPPAQMSIPHPGKTEQSVRVSMDVPNFTEYVPQLAVDAAVGGGKPPVRKAPVDFDVPEIWEFGFPDVFPEQQQHKPRRVSILRQIQNRVKHLLSEVSGHILPMIAGHFTAAALPPHEKDALPPHEKMELVVFTGNGKVVKK